MLEQDILMPTRLLANCLVSDFPMKSAFLSICYLEKYSPTVG